jgi:hypothetical protein
MADEGLNSASCWSSWKKSSAKDFSGRFAIENPQKLRQSVMEITYGSVLTRISHALCHLFHPKAGRTAGAARRQLAGT